MNGFTDTMLFEAIRKFQKDNGLSVTGSIRPNDATAQALESRKPQGKYIWRTVRDDKVRSGHAMRDGQIFDYTDPPEGGHPGIDYNCRCWAEQISATADNQAMIDYVNASGEYFVVQQKLEKANKELVRVQQLKKRKEKEYAVLEKKIGKELAESKRAKNIGAIVGGSTVGAASAMAGLYAGGPPVALSAGVAGIGLGLNVGPKLFGAMEEGMDILSGNPTLTEISLAKIKLRSQLNEISIKEKNLQSYINNEIIPLYSEAKRNIDYHRFLVNGRK